jgi:hypothetical protein
VDNDYEVPPCFGNSISTTVQSYKLLATLITVFSMGTNVAIGIDVGCLTTVLHVLKT